MTRNGDDWISTHTGRKFWPLDPDPADVHIGDIAHALSQTCRFTGHCRRPYSVAEHSVLVSMHCPSGMELDGLLHDAAEAYFADVSSPVKRRLPALREIEGRIQQAVCEKFGLRFPIPPEVKEVDQRLLVDEQGELMPRFTREQWWPDGAPKPLNCEIRCWEPMVAETAFILEFYRLGGQQ